MHKIKSVCRDQCELIADHCQAADVRGLPKLSVETMLRWFESNEEGDGLAPFRDRDHARGTSDVDVSENKRIRAGLVHSAITSNPARYRGA